LLILGELLNAQDQARKITDDMSTRIKRVVDRVRTQSHQPRVFFQIGVSPIVSTGTQTFIHELITQAGGINVAAGPTPYPRFSIEQVLEQAPEVILIASMAKGVTFQKVKDQWEAWPSLPAVRNGAVYIISADIFNRPTPRLVQGLELLAHKLHPELFGDMP
jgi:iron complex transport system substrate-binding protein